MNKFQKIVQFFMLKHVLYPPGGLTSKLQKKSIFFKAYNDINEVHDTEVV